MVLCRNISSIKGLVIKALTTTFLLLAVLVPSRGQLISVQSIVSRDSLMIGEQIGYTLRIDADSEVDFILPSIQDTLSSSLEVLSHQGTDTSYTDGRTVVQQHYTITGFESGSHIVPSQELVYRREGLVDTARSMPLIINLYDPPVDTTQQIRPIKPPINTPLTFKEVLPWAAAALGGLLLIAAAIYLIRRYLIRKKDPNGISSKPLEPAHVIAFRELDKLKEEKLWALGEVKEYYTRLTEITRHYIEQQYDIPAMESTTEEILNAFSRANPEDNLLDEILKELLELADLVKFAREDPLPVDNQTNLNNAYIFVQKTYPRFVELDVNKDLEDE